ncbi:hypothetical protein EJ074_16565 [Mesorhizobium sp. M3A.F.Ca.ET.080.04.2.1]|uniref:hypothetical protein n=1 Tax=Mesorhizobium sp. M3A.F.Ca.ET.080.04.2.1 TaxID=2493676 RepID=UPI000F752F5B|nr:hypothetical protein [Mesorhizobium sp. M3A.F.Ca.ET.080.04.2.1]AZO10563.1 hypothetical protein EJ074_16565 [Mesorhizobium sp. M3A.F.Ca.ET.080.04.2.1]RWF25658.1 MAG: hypothetical protein EOS64_03825 [Mesorhizobium sp.]
MKVSLEAFHNQVAVLAEAVAKSRLSADGRHDLFDEFDPYAGKIEPALLNAGHLATYAMVTGMIEPFDASRLIKPATYLVAAEGPVRYRNDKGHVERFYLSADPKKRETESCVRDSVQIAPNSICFLTLEPTFRMPSYIAARFNLLIRDVYRGLLVGTGPLVDPGFDGRLSIPIHNFTTQPYDITAGEGIVYFEFTKLSWQNPAKAPDEISWLPDPVNCQPPFPASKNKRKSLDNYLAEATGNGPPQHAIELSIAEMRKQAEWTRNVLNIATVAGAIGVAGLVITCWQLFAGAQQFAADAQTELRGSRYQLAQDVQVLKDRVADLKRQLDASMGANRSPANAASNK